MEKRVHSTGSVLGPSSEGYIPDLDLASVKYFVSRIVAGMRSNRGRSVTRRIARNDTNNN